MDLNFGAWLKRRRRALDLTQDDLAARAFCSVNSIRKIESGDLTPSKALAKEIARALDLPESVHAEFIRLARTPDATAPENAFTEIQTAPAPLTLATQAPAVKFHPPALLTSTIGRERDAGVILATLRLPAARLVTLTGPPGTGKTRLATEVAGELANEFEHGAVFVALAPLAHPARVEIAITETLELRTDARTTPADALRNFMRDKQLLLVLDNFEHILDAAPLTQELLRAAPRLKILVTSREPLRVYGERELPVAPLTLPPLDPLPPLHELEDFSALQLFIERAREVRTDFTLNETNAETIARLCVGLDGLPLALEMAAARLKWDSPQTLLAQWNQRLNVLQNTQRGREPRQQTLRGALAWSVDRLEETERALFFSMGALTGDGHAATIAALAQCGEREAAALLQMLVEKNLVCVEGDRFWQFETMREYAREQLAARGELDNVVQRHAEYFLRMAENIAQAFEAQQTPELLDQLHDEHENLRAALDYFFARQQTEDALRFCLALGPFWTVRGHWSEGRERLERAAQLTAGDSVPAQRACALHQAAEIARRQGDFEASAALFEAALELREMLRDTDAITETLAWFGWLCHARGDRARARTLADTGLALGTDAQPTRHRVQLLALRGRIEMGIDNYRAARESTTRALDMSRALNDPTGLSDAWNQLGIIAYSVGEFEAARQAYAASLALRRTLGNDAGVRSVLNNLGVCAMEQCDYAAARPFLRESVAISRRLSETAGEALGLSNLAETELGAGNVTLAQALCSAALDIASLMNKNAMAVRMARQVQIQIALACGNYTDARAQSEQELGFWRELDDKKDIGASLKLLASAFVGEENNLEAAHATLHQAVEIRRAYGHALEIASTHFESGMLFLHTRDFAQASREFQIGLELSRAQNALPHTAFALYGLAAAAASQGAFERAAQLVQESKQTNPYLDDYLRGLPLWYQQDFAAALNPLAL